MQIQSSNAHNKFGESFWNKILKCKGRHHFFCLWVRVLQFKSLYYTVLYYTVLYCSVLYYIVLYYTVLYCVYCTAQYKTVPHCSKTVHYRSKILNGSVCCTVLYCSVLHCTIQNCTILQHTVLVYCIVLHCNTHTKLYCSSSQPGGRGPRGVTQVTDLINGFGQLSI